MSILCRPPSPETSSPHSSTAWNRPAPGFCCALVAGIFAAGLFVGDETQGPQAARGDIVLLESGGRLHGKWLNPKRQPDDPYEVELEGGGTISLPVEQVREVKRQTADELEYERLAPTFDDSVAGQWAAAEWCREHSLKGLREHHLRRIVELQPDHAKAWSLLGYVQVQGQWKRPQEVAGDNGYRYFQGKWRLEQEVAVLVERQRAAAKRLEWKNRIAKWIVQSRGHDRAAVEAHRELAAIRDPLAVPALIQALTSDRRPAYRLFIINILNEIDSPDALQAILRTPLLEVHPEVIHGAIDRIVKRKTPQIVEFYCKALGDGNNLVVNRAAYVLGRLDDPSAVGPLIRSLQTQHVIMIRPPSAARGNGMGVMIPKDDPSAAVIGGPQIQTAPEPVAQRVVASNEEVLAALLKITGADFGYHTDAWKQWHATWNARRIPQLDARRAP